MCGMEKILDFLIADSVKAANIKQNQFMRVGKCKAENLFCGELDGQME